MAEHNSLFDPETTTGIPKKCEEFARDIEASIIKLKESLTFSEYILFLEEVYDFMEMEMDSIEDHTNHFWSESDSPDEEEEEVSTDKEEQIQNTCCNNQPITINNKTSLIELE